jgi:hypothetical protein
MSDRTSEQKLKPCRWCGQAPGIEGPDEDDNVAIVCANGNNCTVLPSVGAISMEYAIETWNRGAGT